MPMGPASNYLNMRPIKKLKARYRVKKTFSISKIPDLLAIG